MTTSRLFQMSTLTRPYALWRFVDPCSRGIKLQKVGVDALRQDLGAGARCERVARLTGRVGCAAGAIVEQGACAEVLGRPAHEHARAADRGAAGVMVA